MGSRDLEHQVVYHQRLRYTVTVITLLPAALLTLKAELSQYHTNTWVWIGRLPLKLLADEEMIIRLAIDGLQGFISLGDASALIYYSTNGCVNLHGPALYAYYTNPERLEVYVGDIIDNNGDIVPL